jgi:hypothetical protein
LGDKAHLGLTLSKLVLHVRVINWDTMIERYASFTTLYKLEILEVLDDLPAALLPLLQNQCLMRVSNGEMVVDGMRISRPFTDDDAVLRPTAYSDDDERRELLMVNSEITS